MEKNFGEYTTKELGVYVIKRLYEMGYSEEQIKIILNRSLDISIREKLKEKQKKR